MKELYHSYTMVVIESMGGSQILANCSQDFTEIEQLYVAALAEAGHLLNEPFQVMKKLAPWPLQT